MTTWVLLRGLTRESRHWGHFPSVFRERFPAARVLALDLPGCGRRCSLRSPTRIADLVDCLRADVRSEGVEERVHVLGLSLGAMVAADWASRYPAEVAGCVLVNTSARPFSSFNERLRPANYVAMLRLALFPGEARSREAAILRLTSAVGDPTGEVLEAWTTYRRESPISRANALRQLLAAFRYRAYWQKPVPPLLVLASAGDQLVDPRCSERLAHHWSAPLAIHSSAGHDLPLDDGPWVADRIAAWLNSMGSDSIEANSINGVRLHLS